MKSMQKWTLLPLMINILKVDCEKCLVNPNVLKDESEFAIVSCQPHLHNNSTKADPLTVCIFTCKLNNRRWKHYCGSNGEWDIEPGEKSCALSKLNQCKHPSHQWNNWTWQCDNDNEWCTGNILFREMYLKTERKIWAIDLQKKIRFIRFHLYLKNYVL